MLRDAATTCDASHDRWTLSQDLGALTLLTAEDEAWLAREFESLLAPSRSAAPGGGPGRRARVLVVDDNPDAAYLMGECLRATGHDVRVVSDSRGALAAARELEPDAVLLDIGMPFLDGYELARRLRADRRFDRCLLVAVTGYGDEVSRRRGREAGFDHHFAKPADMDALIGLIDQAA
ncbi:response regulator [Paludisphaera soli]|uniref:response regulator n=1 Tax=Paludisphaera soli TaxID=2712865 RepID=UPI0013EE08EF|nr:response regulator [Paludisphaera soli]